MLQKFSAFFQYFDTVSVQIGKTSCIKKRERISFFFFFGRNIAKFGLVTFEQVVLSCLFLIVWIPRKLLH